MKKSQKNQFAGFLKTPPLWLKSEIFDLHQFNIPETSIPENSKILKDIQGLLTNFVLGKRIESYFAYALKLSGKYTILAENFQIRENKITQGEIDFLIENEVSRQQFHVEVVYKFYVYDPRFENELERWIGPNRKDTLLRKLRKLKEHQFPMLFHPQTEKALKSLNLFAGNFQQQVCFKAHLFIPKNCNNEGFPYINGKCIAGYWIKFDEFELEIYSEFGFFAPKKQDWPVEPENNEIWHSFEMIKIQIMELFSEKKSPLIWMRRNDTEFERFFVVWW